jgi:hypothetical protein
LTGSAALVVIGEPDVVITIEPPPPNRKLDGYPVISNVKVMGVTFTGALGAYLGVAVFEGEDINITGCIFKVCALFHPHDCPPSSSSIPATLATPI